MGHFLTDFKRSLYCRIKWFASGNGIRDSKFLRLLHEIQRLGRETCRFLAWHEEKACFCEKKRCSGARQAVGEDHLPSCWLVPFLVELRNIWHWGTGATSQGELSPKRMLGLTWSFFLSRPEVPCHWGWAMAGPADLKNHRIIRES